MRAHRLAEVRQELGLTQSEVAARTAVRQEWVSAIERGETVSTEVGTMAAHVAALGGTLGDRRELRWPPHRHCPVTLLLRRGSRSTVLALSSYAYCDALVAKAGISISLEQDQAERIRQHAERAGMDVSAYLVHAATRQMAESDAIEEQFAEVDALIARAERAADGLPAEPVREPTAELTEQERREVDEALALVHGRDRQGRRPGHAA
ncbi:helix-turn-helix domain-containing protein [Streptomyces sp. NPDC007264]|uniref:helix-turn-helix domain-containing protein n=1 Tax=Streptomyces sp. NPDC007264 TaxID=3364777 RepID=UPI0036DB73C7